MKKSTETYSPWKPAKPDATMGALAGTLGTLLRTPFEALAARVYTALAVSYPDVREAHGAVFRHLPLAGASVSDLARRAGMAKQSMGFLVDSLLGAGYLEAAQSATDRRAKLVRLSARGMQMQSRAIEIGLAIEAEWAQSMGEVEMGALRALLKVLAESIPESTTAGNVPAETSTLSKTRKKKETV
ncbi:MULTISPECIES: MarR family winged helix-turn-helix transcriptional regulator [Sphingobium]|uniref:HTH marR-type domain-containing protein n=1 Tax=Sphingobium indicum F2 TaxID=1450518 RepID=A0A8E1C0U8_9SPHN|nr:MULTISPECIES: MarR family transcriptional regulator [Sphingobium]AMK20754.1 MarR family transcriptional regulator [Sphingobium sp. MI1205]EPR12544.1 hypothetical protein M527_01300 [Sphingobium indicum IP26]EQB03538.1 hypothetical protein L286_12465 [Sphingobium sp. HDIP04]KER34492.1 hypothetical protein AL00_20310 [Sphingobium indicum F2]